MPSIRLSRNIFRHFMVMTCENTDFYILTLQLFPRTSFLGKMHDVPHTQMEIFSRA